MRELTEGYTRALLRSAEAFRKNVYQNRLAVLRRPSNESGPLNLDALDHCLRLHQEKLGEIEIPPAWGNQRYSELFRSLEHAFRNALEHGLDTPHSEIVTHFSVVSPKTAPPWLKITVTDRGRGIDPELIRRRLRAQGKATFAAKASEWQLLDSLFEIPGTGLHRVRMSAKALGGTAKLFSITGKGTKVVVMVPFTEE